MRTAKWTFQHHPFLPLQQTCNTVDFVTSSASASVSGGKIVGSRRASIVLPLPGDPTIKILCPPAAAISSALLLPAARALPQIHIIDTGCCRADSFLIQYIQNLFTPQMLYQFKQRCRYQHINTVNKPSFSAVACRDHNVFLPMSRACRIIGNTPAICLIVPSSASSPTKIVSSTCSCCKTPLLTKIPTAIGRSRPEPSFSNQPEPDLQ